MRQVPVLNAQMGAAVLAHLSQYADLSGLLTRYEGAEEGFIAGQAVASAISELFYDGLGVVYNDVDVFLLSDKFEHAEKQVLTTLDFEVARMGTSYRHIVPELTTVYDVCRTRRRGMLNEVLCKPLLKFKEFPEFTSKLFLQSFDLNCVQVGVRLSDGRLVWTPAFEQFLTTREMLVTNVKTPLHTAIRWFRKKAELEGVFGHDDRTMELLSAMRLRVGRRREEATTVSYSRVLDAQSMFGPVYTDKARGVLAQMGRYFELERVPGRSIELHTLVPRGQPRAELLDAEIWDATLPLYARALQGHWRRHTCQNILAALGAPRDDIVRLNVLVEGAPAMEHLNNPKNAQRLRKALDEHPLLSRFITLLDTSRQLAFVRALDDLARREGPWAYGVFEQLEGERVYEFEHADVNDVPALVERQFAEQVKAFEKAVADRPEPLKPLIGEMDLAGYRITELTSFKELADESARMHHCVAGYFRAVMEGHTRILRLQRPRVQDSLTLEVFKRKGVWHNAQLRGLLNRPNSMAEYQVAEQYVDLLNLQTLAQKVKVALPAGWLQYLAERSPSLVSRIGKVLKPQVVYGRKARAALLLSTLKRYAQPALLKLMTGSLLQGPIFVKEAYAARPPGYVGWKPFIQACKQLLATRWSLVRGQLHAEDIGRQLDSVLRWEGRYAMPVGFEDLSDDVPF